MPNDINNVLVFKRDFIDLDRVIRCIEEPDDAIEIISRKSLRCESSGQLLPPRVGLYFYDDYESDEEIFNGPGSSTSVLLDMDKLTNLIDALQEAKELLAVNSVHHLINPAKPTKKEDK